MEGWRPSSIHSRQASTRSIVIYTRQKIAAIGKAIAIPMAARMESLPSIRSSSVLPETMHARVGSRKVVNNARLVDGAFQQRKGWHGGEKKSADRQVRRKWLTECGGGRVETAHRMIEQRM